MNKISIRFTYDTVTPESAEHGDFNESGFCDRNGSVISENSTVNPATIPDEEIEQWLEPGDLYYCIDKACDLGISERSLKSWYTADSVIIDYSTDERWTYAMHIDGLTDEQLDKIAAILNKGRVSSDDQDYLDSIDGQLSIA
jgi:hypothetical protein